MQLTYLNNVVFLFSSKSLNFSFKTNFLVLKLSSQIFDFSISSLNHVFKTFKLSCFKLQISLIAKNLNLLGFDLFNHFIHHSLHLYQFTLNSFSFLNKSFHFNFTILHHSFSFKYFFKYGA